MSGAALHLFEATGIEIEYMIVDRSTLAIKPIADELIRAECGSYEAEIERGDIAWSNELALHVVEFKTNGPATALHGLAGRFQENVRHANELLAPLEAMLLPGGMHPWMDPHAEMRLWPHEHSPVYEAFDRIFDCSGHGWANLQSMHVNLPFADDEEFGRLHAAIRVLLPVLPALAASSPVIDGRATGVLDNRLAAYARNAAKIPSVTGDVIPEAVFDRVAYERDVLGRIYADLAPHDPRGVLRHEWVNARGCIARFDRNAIEIRLLGVQECPLADLAVAAAVRAGVRALVDGAFGNPALQRGFPTHRLTAVYRDVVRDADAARIADPEYLRLLGYPRNRDCTAGELWQHLVSATMLDEPHFDEWQPALKTILGEGCLARRVLTRLGQEWNGDRLKETMAVLARCLADGVMFRAAG
jgi:hypothetical protein